MRRQSRFFLAVAPFLLGSLLHAQIPNPQKTRPGQGIPLFKPGTDRIMTSATALTQATHAPGDTGRLFVVEQRGRIVVLDLATEVVNPVAYLDIDSRVIGGGGERGLLGLAFHPDYQSNGLFYVNYSRNGDGATVIAEYAVTIDPDVADFNSERILLTIAQPQSNHNGGWLDFSPLDGYLYIATGDGGNACDTGTGHTAGIGNAQDTTANLLGKLLRIDPLGGLPYGIPATNPFVGLSGDDEIWAYGLRNPWRCGFDSLTGDLYVGDVGQNLLEEVNFQDGGSIGGENYGWRCREGTGCSTSSPSSCPTTTGCTCPGSTPGLVDPIHDYNSTSAHCTVIGGYPYRGSLFPQLQGDYFFADYCSEGIWAFKVVNGVKTDFRSWKAEFTPSIDGFNISSIVSFGEDADRELYLIAASAIFKVVPQP
jgi:glucose/arabinose dehydrogenase